MPASGNPKETSATSSTFPKVAGRNLLVFLLKAVIAGALLFWLTSSGRLDLSHLKSITWSSRTVGLVAAGVGGVWVGILLLGFRLSLMVRSVGISLSLNRACSLTAIGLFSGSILPGVVGGDIIKVVYLCRGEGSSRRALATLAVMCDRAVGLFSLFLLGTIVLAAAWAAGSLPFRSPVLLVAPAIVLSAALLFVLYAWKRNPKDGLHANVDGLPASRIQQAISVADHFVQRPRLMAGVIGLSLVNHILVCFTFLISAQLLGGIEISALQQFLLNPLAMFMNVIPITPGGVGVTESAFSYLYDAAGCTVGATIGILGRTIQYIAYIAAGLPAFIFHRKLSG